MKTRNLYFLFCAILISAMIAGCKKNGNETNTMVQPSIDKGKLESVVKYCTNRILHPTKTNDSIPVDSLNFYLSSTANYVHGISAAHGDMQKIDSNFFIAPCSNGKVAMADMVSIYNILIDSIRASYRRIQSSNKNFLVAIVNIKNQKSNQISLKVTSIIIYGSNSSFGSFDTTDYWRYWVGSQGNDGGYCGGPYSGQSTNIDAAMKLNSAIMLRKGTVNGIYVAPFFTYMIDLWSFQSPVQTPDWPCYKKYSFFCESTGWSCAHDCLMPFEMNWYLNRGEHVCYTANDATYDHGARPPDMNFMSIALYGDLCISSTSVMCHLGNIYYGTWLQGGYQSPL